MEKFSLQHTVLYAKGWYKRADGKNITIWQALAKMLEMDGYLGTFAGDTDEQIKHRVAYLIVSQFDRLPKTHPDTTLVGFFEGIQEHTCWKFGYYTKNHNMLRKQKDIDESPEYDFLEASVRYCLSHFSRLSRNEWELCEPNYTKFPRKNGVTLKMLNTLKSLINEH